MSAAASDAMVMVMVEAAQSCSSRCRWGKERSFLGCDGGDDDDVVVP